MSAGLYRGVSGFALGVGLYRGAQGFSGDFNVGYYILLGGVYVGSFNETTGLAGVIGNAVTSLPNLGAGFTWSIKAGSDARISVASGASGQPSNMNISTSSAIFSGDSAAFIVRVANGVVGTDPGAQAIEISFTAVGTVAASRVIREDGGFVLREDGGKILREA